MSNILNAIGSIPNSWAQEIEANARAKANEAVRRASGKPATALDAVNEQLKLTAAKQALNDLSLTPQQKLDKLRAAIDLQDEATKRNIENQGLLANTLTGPRAVVLDQNLKYQSGLSDVNTSNEIKQMQARVAQIEALQGPQRKHELDVMGRSEADTMDAFFRYAENQNAANRKLQEKQMNQGVWGLVGSLLLGAAALAG